MHFPDEGLAGSAKERDKSFKDAWRYQGRCQRPTDSPSLPTIFYIFCSLFSTLSVSLCRGGARQFCSLHPPEKGIQKGKGIQKMSDGNNRNTIEGTVWSWALPTQLPAHSLCSLRGQRLLGSPAVSTQSPFLHADYCTLLLIKAGYQDLLCHQGTAKSNSYCWILRPVSDTLTRTVLGLNFFLRPELRCL